MAESTAYERVLARMREICLSLPDAEELIKWGQPHFCVNGSREDGEADEGSARPCVASAQRATRRVGSGGKIFAGCGADDSGEVSLGCKLEMTHADILVANDPRVTRAKYVGQHGWIDLDARGEVDWEQVRGWILESYHLIAPKRSIKKLAEKP